MNELWKMKCKADLFNLRKNEAAILSIPEEINMERERMTSIKSAATGTAPVQGGGTSYEERMNNSIVTVDALKDKLMFAEKDVKLTRQALSLLTEEERRVLEVLYIDKQKNGAQRLCGELGILDETTVWKKATRALSNYCTARYSSFDL